MRSSSERSRAALEDVRALLRAVLPVAASLLALLALWGAPVGVAATTLAPPTIQVPGDTIRPRAPLPDTLVGRIRPDTLLPPDLREHRELRVGELVVRDLDRLVEVELPRIPRAPPPVAPGWERGVWAWTLDELHDVRALTLAEFLDLVPGITLLRGGDFGQPTGVTAFGMGPENVRVFRDGMELPPLDGGSVDLARVGIAALESIRIERRPGELRVELRTLRLFDTRPYTLLEVGTGDLNTNLFRGTFGHPNALGGHFLIALDRIDTQGPFRGEPGASFGAVLGYTLFVRNRAAFTWDLRRMASRRPEDLWAPRNVHRSDMALRGSLEVREGLVADAFYQRSTLSPDPELTPEDPAWALVSQQARRQGGLDLALTRDRWWTRAGVRLQGGDGWPSSVQALSAGGDLPALGGVSGALERESWDEEANIRLHARVWTRPLLGISLFGEVDDGRRGVPRFVPQPVPDPPDEENGEVDENEEDPGDPLPPGPVSFTERNAVRLGAEFRHEGLRLGAAGLRIRADSLHPTGLPMDRGSRVIPGGERFGVEVSGRIPLTPILTGLALEGSVQFWESGEPWSYLPLHHHDARITFHNVFLASRNLEVWADVGVRGRDGMVVFLPDPEGEGELGVVPSFQSWFARIQVRVVTARIFLDWENFTIRDANQDFPGRILPPTRTMFGVRWTMWN